jgi:hypothetical protein
MQSVKFRTTGRREEGRVAGLINLVNPKRKRVVSPDDT